MIRRLLLLAAAVVALSSQSAYGLGLGNLNLSSSLNQEFNAEIELTNPAGLAIEEILPNLASQADFNRVGVERNYLLTDLRFKVVEKDGGVMVIKVTSNRPIIEPFLNFIVEVLWPNGRILREYTVLLDPPEFGQRGVAPISTSTSATSQQRNTVQQQTGQQTQSRRPVPKTPVRIRAEGEVVADEYGVTGAGDTLWKIAMKVRPDGGVSIQQTMLALQRANPEAFINNNINLLKAGHVLRIPDRDEIQRDSARAAVAEVRAQNDEFDNYRSGSVAQLDATRRRTGASGSADSNDDGELKLLASDTSSGQRAGDGGSRNEALESELAVAREDLDRARRANSEINVRMDDLAGQVETLNEIVKLKDDQLAALRAQVQKMQELSEMPATDTPAEAERGDEGSLLTNPFVLGALGLLLVFGIAAALILRRRRQQDSGLQTDSFVDEAIEEASDLEDNSADVELAPEAQADDEDEELAPQTADVISEAEIYIAYGRFPQAITFLQNAIQAEPERADIQLKLLEVYVQTEDATAFNLQFEQLRALNDEEATGSASGLQQQIPGASENAEAAMEATIISSTPIVAIEADDDDDDLSFDLDDLDSETETDDLGELDMDDTQEMDLELDGDGEITLDLDDDDTLVLDGDDAGLDLDLDLSDDLDLGDADDDSLDLGEDSLELGGDSLDLGEDSLELEADSLDLGDDNLDDTLNLELDDELDLGDGEVDLDLDLGEDDLDLDDDLDLGESLEADSLELGGDSLDLGEDSLELEADSLELGEDSLDLGEDSLELEEDSLELDDDSLTLEDDLDLGDDSLDLGDDDLDLDEAELELDADDLDLDSDLDLGDDDLDLDDDDLGELNLDEDASSKLDLARAYIDMGDSDGARTLLQEVVSEGTDSEITEAKELIEKLD